MQSYSADLSRKGSSTCWSAINLLREGTRSFRRCRWSAILDADKEGFLRSARSLIQTIGRAARNVNGQVILYADVMTGSMQQAIDETKRRRDIQQRYNEEHGITPETIVKDIDDILQSVYERDYLTVPVTPAEPDEVFESTADLETRVAALTKEMREAAVRLEFEKAAMIRDRINQLRQNALLA